MQRALAPGRRLETGDREREGTAGALAMRPPYLARLISRARYQLDGSVASSRRRPMEATATYIRQFK